MKSQMNVGWLSSFFYDFFLYFVILQYVFDEWGPNFTWLSIPTVSDSDQLYLNLFGKPFRCFEK